MKRHLLFILCALFFTSCDRPPINSADFANICYDMFLVRVYVENNPSMDVSTDSLSVYGAILEDYGHTPDDFKAAVDYYVSHSDDYARILKDVQSRIGSEKKRLELSIKDANEAASAYSVAEILTLTGADCPKLDSIPLSLEEFALIFP